MKLFELVKQLREYQELSDDITREEAHPPSYDKMSESKEQYKHRVYLYEMNLADLRYSLGLLKNTELL